MGPSGAGKSTFMNVLSGRASYGQVITEGIFIFVDKMSIRIRDAPSGFV
jgi:ABC-type multidrug transport system ATPase subunit